MLAIEKSKNHQGKCAANVLPCKINHNGPVDVSDRYWAPTETLEGKRTAYFRGRKLNAKTLKVPEGYRGVVLSATDRILPRPEIAQGEEEEAEDVPEIGIMEEEAEFDEVMVWGHDTLPDATADPYTKGMEEWIAFAEQIHSTTKPEVAAPADK
ncbi:hypothetical protein BP6252_08730 [Coleophoma cylindrospora]|uniref:Uncharacterized protein n=1 Tax=Coleophoma cylindrospora TaxID=1849047 RepID=A0A3D8R6X9_9HELO|nr:hypothetical protein BP6252_08730 [Coleophoma cylindrospora]